MKVKALHPFFPSRARPQAPPCSRRRSSYEEEEEEAKVTPHFLS
jgi:hypothetical protein